MSYYRKIIGYGVQFDFLAFNPVEKGFEEEVKELGGNVYYIDKPGLKTAGQYKSTVKRFFKEHTDVWECVHIHEILVQKYIVKAAKKVGGVKKILIHSHASKFVLPEYGISPLKNKFKMFVKSVRNKVLLSGVKRNADFCVACSEDAGRALFGEKIINSDRFCVIKNAIDGKDYVFDENTRREYRDTFGVQDKKVIVLVGRLCEQKNQVFMLDVFKRVHDLNDSYVLLLVGEGHLRQELENKIAENNLSDSVIFTGNRNDVNKILQAADLMALPSIMEGLGIVLIEGQASGLPCIASADVPDNAKITPYFEFISLDKGAGFWADRIINTNLERHDNSEYLVASGYDINSNVEKLTKIYG